MSILRSGLDRITILVGNYYDVEFEKLRGKRRFLRVVQARHIAFWLMRRAGYSLDEIGEYFLRDHTTVLHGEQQTNYRLEIEDDLPAQIKQIVGYLGRAQHWKHDPLSSLERRLSEKPSGNKAWREKFSGE